jgi:hypothetical protein
MNLTGYNILDYFGVERISLKGEYTKRSLADLFIENWIPYYECHKCGRWDYCKYAKPHPANSNRSIDIKCGVAVDCLRNFVEASFPILRKLKRDKIQKYLDGAFYFFKFVYNAEQDIGMCMYPGFPNYFGEQAPIIFGKISRLRDSLNSLAAQWKEIPEFHSKHPVLFVEGHAEKEFIDELKKSHLSWFLYTNVEVYGGKGNRRSKRIQMLLDKYNELGFEIYAQGDADGENTDIFRTLIKTGSIKEGKTFVFDYDFETAVPLPLIYFSLRNMRCLEGISKGEFVKNMDAKGSSVLKRLKSKYGIEMESLKVKFAMTLAGILNDPKIIWWNDEVFMNKTELGRFLRFVQRAT